MKTAYFNCFAGASGDMILGALIDAGLDLDLLKSELAKLNLTGYELSAEKRMKKGISGTKFDVDIPHEHHHRGLNDILEIIRESALDDEIKEKSSAIFTRLARAEAKIHNTTVDQIHFHEVGAVDAIVDITGAAIGLCALGIQRIVVSPIHVGSGTVTCAHGVLPVPAPATLALLKNAPIQSMGIPHEMVTPTGAAILTTLADEFGPLPDMTIQSAGYGLGSRDLDIPNLLRVVIGETGTAFRQDQIQLLETNIDDMNPQFYEHIMERLFKQGARDVYLTPIIMKKNRPGIILSVLAEPARITALTDLIFQETTTLGVRISQVSKRWILPREIITVSTPWGDARVKIRQTGPDNHSASPEYDDCKAIAREHAIPIQDVYNFIQTQVSKKTITLSNI